MSRGNSTSFIFSQVSYNHKNSWVCPSCDQYNGFTDDGDYNRDINTSHISDLTFTRDKETRVASSNGLCESCNLNQELKVTQVARTPYEGEKLEEYISHLERAYKLCPQCQDVLDTRLSELDNKHRAMMLDNNLSKSRLNIIINKKPSLDTRTQWSQLLQFIISLLVFIMIQDSCLIYQILTQLYPSSALMKMIHESSWLQDHVHGLNHLFPHISVSEAVMSVSVNHFTNIIMFILTSLMILAVINKQFLTTIMTTLMITLTLLPSHLTTNMLLDLDTLLLIISAFIMILSVCSSRGSRRSETGDNNIRPARMRSLESSVNSSSINNNTPLLPCGTFKDELIARAVNGDTSGSVPAPSIFSPSLSISSSSLVSPSQIMSSSHSPAAASMRPRLLRSSNESSFNHEFVINKSDEIDNEKDCDLMSTLSIGELSSPRPSSSPFPLRPYSPSQLTNQLFSPPVKKPLLRPSQLSWTAGGYWNGNKQQQSNNINHCGPSRSSSQTSGFISSPSLVSYPHHNYPAPPTPPHSVLSEPINTSQHISLRRRTVEDSISHSSGGHAPLHQPRSENQSSAAPLFLVNIKLNIAGASYNIVITLERILIIILVILLTISVWFH